MNNKTIIILETNPGARLANQLWNYISIYAYCLERGYRCQNWSFFEEKKHKGAKIFNSFFNYGDYFDLPLKNIPIKTLIFFHLKNIKLLRIIKPYHKFVKVIKSFFPEQVIYSENSPFYLPPSENTDRKQVEAIKKLEINNKTIYFSGWLFRNPKGIVKYRREITDYFKPKKEIQAKIVSLTDDLRKKYGHLVGVHIRQGDYKNDFGKGKLYFNGQEINIFLKEYLENFKLDKNKTCFIVCSDERVDLSDYPGLNVVASGFNAAEDLFLLAATDAIIGSNSTFCALASYFGNIPLIIFQRPKLDWGYYQNKKNYFENKYSTFVNY